MSSGRCHLEHETHTTGNFLIERFAPLAVAEFAVCIWWQQRRHPASFFTISNAQRHPPFLAIMQFSERYNLECGWTISEATAQTEDELIELRPQGHSSLPWTSHLLDQDIINFGLESFKFLVHIPAGVGTGRHTTRPKEASPAPAPPQDPRLPEFTEKALARAALMRVDTHTVSPRRRLQGGSTP